MAGPPSDRLESWKEIATYLNRSVRTVRRWEAAEGLPVHRHMHRAQGSVYAYRSEIDAWRHARDARVTTAAGPLPASMPSATKAIVVLPFVNLSSDGADAYFGDALTDEVITDLSKVRTLRVVSRTSAMAIADRRLDVRALSRQLGVQFVVQGPVRRDGARFRLTAQLIDAATDDHLWSEKYQGTIDDVFAFQERLARAIVGELQVRLSADEDRRMRAQPIRGVGALEYYLQARQESLRWRRDAIERAIELLHRALTLAGPHPTLYAALGRAYLQYREAGIDFGDTPLQEAERCVEQIAVLDADSVAAHQLSGWIRYSRGQIVDAVRDLRAAHERDPSDPDTLGLLANCYLISGRVATARPFIAHLLAVDPLTPLTRCMPGWAEILEGRFGPALPAYREMFEMDPGNPMARLFYTWVLALNDRRAEASALAESAPPAIAESVPVRVAVFLARALGGDRAGAEAQVTAAVEHAATGTELFARFLAQGYALAGAHESALRWLSMTIDRGFIHYPFLTRHDPFLRALDGRADFAALMDRTFARWQRFE